MDIAYTASTGWTASGGRQPRRVKTPPTGDEISAVMEPLTAQLRVLWRQIKQCEEDIDELPLGRWQMARYFLHQARWRLKQPSFYRLGSAMGHASTRGELNRAAERVELELAAAWSDLGDAQQVLERTRAELAGNGESRSRW